MTDTPEISANGSMTSKRRWLPFAIGAGGGVLGLVPWLASGATLPLQNLWATRTMPDDMPFVLLPVNQYYAIQLFSLLLLGGVFAGIAVHLARSRRPMATWPAALGLGVVHAIAIGQSFAVVGGGLRSGSDATLYLVGMLAGALVGALLAQLGFWMGSRRSSGAASCAVGLAAVPFGTWCAQFVVAFTGEVFPPPFLPLVVTWLPAIVVIGALVWCGARPLRRVAVWVVSLLALWVLPALFTAIQGGLGMRVLQGDLGEMARVAGGLFSVVIGETWPPAVAALAIALVGIAARDGLARRAPDVVAPPD